MNFDVGQLSLPRWEVDLYGDESDLRHLVKYVNTGERFFYYDGVLSQTLMVLSDFPVDADPETVISAAAVSIKELSGVLLVSRGSRSLLQIGGIMQRQKNGSRHVYATANCTARASTEVFGQVLRFNVNGDFETVPEPKPNSVLLISLTKTDAAFARVMRYAASDDANQWGGLYRTFEAIQNDFHEVGLSAEKLHLASGKEVTRFERTANSSASGDRSRHGHEKFAPPANPMALDEARAFVQSVLHGWTAYRLQRLQDAISI